MELFFKILEMLRLIFLLSLLQKTAPVDTNSHTCPKAQVFTSTQGLRWAGLQKKPQSWLKMRKIPGLCLRWEGPAQVHLNMLPEPPVLWEAEEIPLPGSDSQALPGRCFNPRFQPPHPDMRKHHFCSV